MSNVYLGVPAVRQILAKESKSDAEDQKLIEKLERSCKNFDHSKKGRLTPDDFFNVVKLQNGIAISKDEVREKTKKTGGAIIARNKVAQHREQ